MKTTHPIVVLISAGAEWRVVRQQFPNVNPQSSPYGEWFTVDLPVGEQTVSVVFLQGGWGKIASAASAQYAIDKYQPALLVNLGTCGGFTGQIEVGDIILANRTLVYDIIEQMGDPAQAIAHYNVKSDLSWLVEPLPLPVIQALLVSADRDLVAKEIPHLQSEYGAIAGDWESGAIAWVAARNQIRCLILRGVSDLVSIEGGEAYGRIDLFRHRTITIMTRLLDSLPAWIKMCHNILG